MGRAPHSRQSPRVGVEAEQPVGPASLWLGVGLRPASSALPVPLGGRTVHLQTAWSRLWPPPALFEISPPKVA